MGGFSGTVSRLMICRENSVLVRLIAARRVNAACKRLVEYSGDICDVPRATQAPLGILRLPVRDQLP